MVVVLAAAVCAVAAGAQSYVAIAEWVADLPDEVAAALGLAEKCPCESTIRRVVQRLDGDRFDAVISAWVTPQLRTTDRPNGRRRAVAVDGKALCGARTVDGAPQHLLAVIDHHARVVLGQVDVAGVGAEGKTGEIAAFAPLRAAAECLNVAWSTWWAFRHTRGLSRSGRSASSGIAAPSTSTGTTVTPRSSAAAISNATRSSGSSRRRPSRSEVVVQSLPINASRT